MQSAETAHQQEIVDPDDGPLPRPKPPADQRNKGENASRNQIDSLDFHAFWSRTTGASLIGKCTSPANRPSAIDIAQTAS